MSRPFAGSYRRLGWAVLGYGMGSEASNFEVVGMGSDASNFEVAGMGSVASNFEVEGDG